MNINVKLLRLQIFICIPLFLSSFLIFTSCNNSEDVTTLFDSEIRLGTGVKLMKVTSIGTQLPNGQQLGVFISEDSPSPTVSYNQNLLYTADGAGGLSGTTQYFPETSHGIKISAYHPYTSESSDQYIFSVLADQNSDKNIYASDLLYCEEFTQARTNAVINISLSHKLSQITYELIPGLGSPDLTGAKVSVMNAYTAIEFNRRTGVLGSVSLKQEVKLNEGGGIVVPQTIPAGTKLIKITLKNGREMFYTTESEISLDSGKNHKFKLQINISEAIGVDTEVGEWEEGGSTVGNPYTEIAKGKAGLLSWIVTDDGILTISGTDKMPSYENESAPWHAYRHMIKSIILEEGVASVGKRAFSDYASVKDVVIPQSVDSIHTSAFAGCNGLTSIVLPEGLKIIDVQAFRNCTSLENIVFPSTLKTILDEAFEGCSALKDFILPDGLESIWWDAFANCTSLTHVTIPKTMQTPIMYSNNYFIGCTNLLSINVSPDNPRFNSKDGVFFNQDVSLLAFPAGKGGNYVVPGTVTIIERNAFYGCVNLTGITLPDGLEYIRPCAFKGCMNLTEIVIPRSVTSINVDAFAYCSRLEKVTIMATTPPSLNVGESFRLDTDVLYVPQGSLSAYKANADWSAAFSDIREL